MAVSNAPKGAPKYGKGEFLIPAGEIATLKVNRTAKRGRIITGTGYVTSELRRVEVQSIYEPSYEVK